MRPKVKGMVDNEIAKHKNNFPLLRCTVGTFYLIFWEKHQRNLYSTERWNAATVQRSISATDLAAFGDGGGGGGRTGSVPLWRQQTETAGRQLPVRAALELSHLLQAGEGATSSHQRLIN